MAKRQFNPRTAALAFRIWQHCQPIGWNCTLAECADVLREDVNRVRWVAQHKRWLGRFRIGSMDEQTFYLRFFAPGHHVTAGEASDSYRTALRQIESDGAI